VAPDPGYDLQHVARDEVLRGQLPRIVVALVVGFVVLALAIMLVTAAAKDVHGQKAGPGDYARGVQIPARRDSLVVAASAAGCRLLATQSEGRAHTTAHVRYHTNPPTSGDHAPLPAPDGAYVKSPPAEETVHSLEHGRIFIQFRPDASTRVRGELFALFAEDKYHMLLGPNTTGMSWLVAVTAWRHALLCPRMNDRVFDAARLFRDTYRDRGPELVK
jgi:Protein of unknown function (DUF3105)